MLERNPTCQVLALPAGSARAVALRLGREEVHEAVAEQVRRHAVSERQRRLLESALSVLTYRTLLQG
jgi:hypothetical protein